MEVRQLTSPTEIETYGKWVTTHPQGNLWQSLERKAYIEAQGKEVRIYSLGSPFVATAMVVIDRTSFGLSTWDIPRGPLWTEGGEEKAGALLDSIVNVAKKEGALTLFASPQKKLPTTHYPLPTSQRLVYASATRIVDLTPPEEQILAQMHEKGRYNIRVGQRNGITVEQSDDIGVFHHLLQQTGARDAFTIHSESHYRAMLDRLSGSFLLIARNKEQEPVAGLLGVIWKDGGIYYYGASSYEHRSLMAPYLLQWEAMKLCKERGCTSYDLLGIAPEEAGKDHPWHGISDFKRKFGGTVVRYEPEQMIVLRPMVRKLLEWKRKIIG